MRILGRKFGRPGFFGAGADLKHATRGWRLWLPLALAAFILNFTLSFHNIWPTLWITTRNEISVEIAALILLLALYSELVRVPSSRTMTVLAVTLLICSVGRYAEVTAPALYGRPVNLYWDAPHVLNVVSMLEVAAAPLTVLLVGAGVLGLLAAAFLLIRWSLARVRIGLGVTRARRTLAALSAALVGLYVAGYSSSRVHTLRWFSLPVTATYTKQVGFALDAYREARQGGRDLCPSPPPEYDLTALGGDDVFVVFMESYGATAYDRPEISTVVAEGRHALTEAAADTGRSIVSAFVESPTFGGVSWLAHITFMTGRAVRNSGTYNLLLTQDCDVVPKAFARAGYRAVALMPGLKQDWPEGAYYGFDEIYGERALAYRGPEFGWWRIPDQYSLAKLDALELSPKPRAPLFLFFPTISSHMPFRPTAPFQPDWSRLLGAAPYDEADVAASLAVTPDWTDLAPDYAATITHTLDYVAGYLRARPELDVVLVLLGDHQPPASVAGEGVRWDVPVHVIARRPELIAGLERAGFAAGMQPASEAIGPMEVLPALLFGGARPSDAVPDGNADGSTPR